MISYRLDIRIDEEELGFYTKAYSCRHAVSNFLIDAREMLEDDIILLCRKIIEAAIIDTEEDILIYESKEITINCLRNLTIVPDKPGDEFEDSVKYTYLNLPRHLSARLDEFDVEYILGLRYEYLEDHCFCLNEDEDGIGDHDDTRRYYSLPDATEYIYKACLEIDANLTLEQVQGVLYTAVQYDMAISDHSGEQIIDLRTIDISSISSN